jgi:hypothetical protein
LAEKKIIRRLLSTKENNVKFRRILIRTIGKDILYRRPCDFFWHLKFFFGLYDDYWYLSLFKSANGKVKGEITPAYAILSEQDVEHVYELLPDTKIIFLLRNPIDKTWSQLRKSKQSSLSVNQIAKLLDMPNIVLRNNYFKTYSIWRSHYPIKQLFIGFFDDIIHNPEDLIIRICKFLGVRTPKNFLSNFSKSKINSAPEMDMPEELRVLFAQKYVPIIKELSENIGGYANCWLEDTEKILLNAR